ncbi:MAG: hypothetical protein E7415_04185 [Ruminococcaceae bacterium]|nr:hypothetical protein [Oscillospiraceae bacterium]
MNIEKMLAGMTPEKLENGLLKLKGVLSEEQMNQVRNVLQNSDKKEIMEKLKGVDIEKYKKDPKLKDLFK